MFKFIHVVVATDGIQNKFVSRNKTRVIQNKF